MGIDRHIIGLYGIGGMVGVGGEGYGVVWVEVGLVNGGSGYFESGLQLSCARILRDSTPKNRVR